MDDPVDLTLSSRHLIMIILLFFTRLLGNICHLPRSKYMAIAMLF